MESTPLTSPSKQLTGQKARMYTGSPGRWSPRPTGPRRTHPEVWLEVYDIMVRDGPQQVENQAEDGGQLVVGEVSNIGQIGRQSAKVMAAIDIATEQNELNPDAEPKAEDDEPDQEGPAERPRTPGLVFVGPGKGSETHRVEVHR